MSRSNPSNISRRTFVRRAGLVAGGTLLGTGLSAAEPAADPSAQPAVARQLPPLEPGGLPRRVLGRANVPVSMFTLGTAPCGGYDPPEIAKLVNVALDEGVTAVDTSEKYGNAQEGVGLGLGRRRKDVFLSTKVFAKTIQEAEKSLATSVKLLKTDHFDLLYFHGLGNTKVEGAMEPDGVFTWLLKQKKAGTCRFVGVSGHNLPGRFAPFLESGEVDALLVLLNFADRYTYRFEETVLPLARKHDVGIVAMKVFGGAANKEYRNPKAGAHVGQENVELAIRYALSIPGVATANLGCHDAEQIRANIRTIKSFQPLTREEEAALAEKGRRLAAKWGPHFGPVTEAKA